MSIALAITADLEQAFRQFSRDFARVSARWVEQGEETPGQGVTRGDDRVLIRHHPTAFGTI